MLRHMTTEFKLKNFFREAPPREAVLGGADSSHNPTINHTKTQEVSGQEGPFRRQPQRVMDSEQYFRSPKRGYCFCNAKQSYRCITCNKINKTLCTQYTKDPVQLWAQQNVLVLNTSLGNNLPAAAGRLHPAVPN